MFVTFGIYLELRSEGTRNFFRSVVCVLAPAKKPTKFEKQMAAALEDLAKQFEGFQSMMKQTLDELSDLKTWRGC
jgi:hypothetical protein